MKTAVPRHAADVTSAPTPGYQPRKYPRRGAIAFVALQTRVVLEQLDSVLIISPDYSKSIMCDPAHYAAAAS